MILILKAWSSSAILVEKKIELILLILPKFSVFEGGGGKGGWKEGVGFLPDILKIFGLNNLFLISFL